MCLGAVLVYGLVVPVHFIILPLIGPVENYNFKSLGHRATGGAGTADCWGEFVIGQFSAPR